MPVGKLTPLGKQLRSALARIRPSNSSASIHYPERSCARGNQDTRDYHASYVVRSATAFAVAGQQPPSSDHAHNGGREGPRRPVRRRLNNRTRVDRITEALKIAGQSGVIPANKPGKIDLSHANLRGQFGRQAHGVTARRHDGDAIPSLLETCELNLEKILASYIQHSAAVSQNERAERPSPYILTKAERALLQISGYTVEDVSAWTNIVSVLDSLEAARSLSGRIASHGPISVPIFVLLYLLRRPQLSARALRIVVEQAWGLLADRKSSKVKDGVPQNAVFLMFNRLLRHAREVWPRSLESITGLLLEFLPDAIFRDQIPRMEHLQTLTYTLNKAMRLIAIPTATQPFKNNRHQEAALVKILRFMASHNPSLQINREGYRAVVTVQLAQPKTDKERQWAELKVLSWPPWKQDRTAMDSDITAEDHGVSKAKETLMRMQEAGYGHGLWEKVALVYAGWDTDRTPTIQTLTLFAVNDNSLHLGTALWVARITCTRTAQEAWACYLAYVDAKLPASQDVYLAIFQKLHKEEQRQRTNPEARKPSQPPPAWRRIYSGDAREVAPLPPSSHLETYTRSLPPAVHELYRQLHKQGTIFDGHCLAFLVANASSLHFGEYYLRASTSRYPEIARLLNPRSSDPLPGIPMPVFAASIQLLTRFSNVPFRRLTYDSGAHEPGIDKYPYVEGAILNDSILDGNHSIVRAIKLLMYRRPPFRPAWNSVLIALAKDVSFPVLHNALLSDKAGKRMLEPNDTELAGSQGALLAYRLFCRVLELLRDSHLDLDAAGFYALCQTTENLAIGSWSLFQRCTEPDHATVSERVKEADNLISESGDRLSAAFAELVGGDSVRHSNGQKNHAHALELPDALHLPSMAALHSYIRALGWVADYPQLLKVVRWMARNQGELDHRRELDKNGEMIMRRAIIALRVFLERSWLTSSGESSITKSSEDRDLSTAHRRLKMLKSPAPPETIDKVRELIDSVEGWGGWPDEDEVEMYCRHSRFQQV